MMVGDGHGPDANEPAATRDVTAARRRNFAWAAASGALFEITIQSVDEAGKPIDVEVMFPASMVRLVVSMRPEPELGFT